MHHLTHPILLEIPATDDPSQTGRDFLAEVELPPQTTTIVLNENLESFKIQDVRLLQENLGYSRSANAPVCYILCGAEKMTRPAQNAMLKILEEPPPNTHLLVVAKTPHELLPTVVSRCVVERWETRSAPPKSGISQQTDTLEAFLKKPSATTYSELISVSETLKDRTMAISELQLLLTRLKDWQPVPHRTLHFLLTALDSLQKNGNVRLVLEDCFFSIKKEAENTPGIHFDLKV